MNKPILVGVTGGIGAGKSMVCKVFNHLGVRSYDADSRAKFLMANDDQLKSELVSAFGAEIFDNENLQREKLAALVFNNEEQLKILNSLVHPAVGRDFDQWVNDNSKEKILIKEAALLIETNSHESLDELIVVMAPEELRVERVVSRDSHRTTSDVQKIMDNQMMDMERAYHASYTVINEGKTLVVPQVVEIYKELIKS